MLVSIYGKTYVELTETTVTVFIVMNVTPHAILTNTGAQGIKLHPGLTTDNTS